MGYSDTRQLIIDTLMGRPAGTEIQPEDHQAFALALNDYIRSVELVAGSGVPVAFAEPNTVPVQPNNGQAVYLSQVGSNSSKTFANFIGQDGNALSVLSANNVAKMVTLLWNGSYWSKQETSIPVITDTTSGYVFKGIAYLTSTPAEVTVPCFYIATKSGVYTHFNLELTSDGLYIFRSVNNGESWFVETIETISSEDSGNSNDLLNRNGVEKTVASIGLTDNYSLNKVLLDLYIPESVYPEGTTERDITHIAISNALQSNNIFISAVRIFIGDTEIGNVYFNFSTAEEANAYYNDVVKMSNGIKMKISVFNKPNGREDYYFSGINRPVNQDFALEDSVNALEDSVNALESRVNALESRVIDAPELNILYEDLTQGAYYNSSIVGNYISGPFATPSWAYKFVNVNEGEEWALRVAGGNSARAWALLDRNDKIIQNSDPNIVDDRIIIPSGVSKLLIQTQLANNFAVKRLEKKSIVTENEENIEVLSKDFESSGLFEIITENIPFGDRGYAYSTVMGQESVLISATDYVSSRIDNISKGDIIEYSVHGGSSVKGWAKILNGIVIEVGLGYAYDTGEVVCDGSFDSMVFNFYLGSGLSDSKKIIYTHTISNISELKNRVRTLESQMQMQTIELKVLCIGNSFTQDSMGYVPYIMKQMVPHVKLTLGIGMIGGSPLAQHLANLMNEDVSVGSTVYSPTNYGFEMSVDGSPWKSSSASIDEILAFAEWDIITFQQSGGTASLDWNTYYAPFIYKIHKKIYEKITYNVQLGWLSVHGTYANNAEAILNSWRNTTNNSKKVVEETGASILFPYGTAIQNLRTISELNALGNYGFLQADNGHLQNGIGCLCAAYSNVLTLLKSIGMDYKGIVHEDIVIDDTFMGEKKIPGPNPSLNQETGSYGIIGMTPDNVYLAQIAAIKSISSPYEVTDLNPVNV